MYFRDRKLNKLILKVLSFEILLFYVSYSLSSLPNPITLIQDGFSETYKTIKYLGSGVQGSVFLVRNIRNGEEFALKIQPINARYDCHRIAELFKNYLKHENIVEFYAYGKDKRNEYLLFEYLPITLEKYLKEGNVALINFLFIMKQTFDVLNFLQSLKIIYLDIKFDNIMICEDLKVKLIDFGLANFEKDQRNFFSSFDMINKRHETYRNRDLAPEVRNRQRYSCNADVHCFAYICRKALKNITIKNYQIMNDADDFFKKCLKEDPSKRITADLALLHPLFNILYDFLICFSNLEDLEISKNETKIRIKDKILYYEHPNYGFELHCCCKNEKIEFTKLELPSKQTHAEEETGNESQTKQRAKRLLDYRVIIDKEVLPIQHLTFSYYNELKNIFSALRVEQKQKSNRGMWKYIIGLSVIVLIVGAGLSYYFFVHKKKLNN
ncbi:protein kinase domain-containing protein [Hamiltosporidium magnivora]|uniref:Protein kinase domain-containing protein n=1 Tax=Hamiltosporidium magnivora TaxID=148818 RepID=A0A4Q9LJU4_9MICR|nr:protein kinase domain-containing protein [Hamiltosporidium magnivora]